MNRGRRRVCKLRVLKSGAPYTPRSIPNKRFFSVRRPALIRGYVNASVAAITIATNTALINQTTTAGTCGLQRDSHTAHHPNGVILRHQAFDTCGDRCDAQERTGRGTRRLYPLGQKGRRRLRRPSWPRIARSRSKKGKAMQLIAGARAQAFDRVFSASHFIKSSPFNTTVSTAAEFFDVGSAAGGSEQPDVNGREKDLAWYLRQSQLRRTGEGLGLTSHPLALVSDRASQQRAAHENQ